MSKEEIAIKALEALARLGNGDQYGSSTGNVIAQTALFEMAAQPAPVQPELWAMMFIEKMLETTPAHSLLASQVFHELRQLVNAQTIATPPAAQPAPNMAYSIDADLSGIRKRAADAIIGALALGAQDSSPPPEGHWLQQFWDIGRAEASKATPPAQPAPAVPAPLTDDQCRAAFDAWYSSAPDAPEEPDCIYQMTDESMSELTKECIWLGWQAAHGITKGQP